MGAQSLVIGKMFGEGFQYGKRRISAMSNEEFNKLTFADMMSNARMDIKAAIPSMKASMSDMDDMVVLIIDMFVGYLKTVIEKSPEIAVEVGGAVAGAGGAGIAGILANLLLSKENLDVKGASTATTAQALAYAKKQIDDYMHSQGLHEVHPHPPKFDITKEPATTSGKTYGEDILGYPSAQEIALIKLELKKKKEKQALKDKLAKKMFKPWETGQAYLIHYMYKYHSNQSTFRDKWMLTFKEHKLKINNFRKKGRATYNQKILAYANAHHQKTGIWI